MPISCCVQRSARPSAFAALSRAAAKYTASVLRRAGASAVHRDWPARATICETCPMRVLVGKVSYCGQPVQRQPVRDAAVDGCGCPTREKARSPEEHCPFTPAMRPATAERSDGGRCDCKWCVAG
jgi:hypothetical protein